MESSKLNVVHVAFSYSPQLFRHIEDKMSNLSFLCLKALYRMYVIYQPSPFSTTYWRNIDSSQPVYTDHYSILYAI